MDQDLYIELTGRNPLLGEFGWDAIEDSITRQFNNYVDLEDDTNFVDIFYQQYHDSCQKIYEQEEEYPIERREVLDSTMNSFLYLMRRIFSDRLGLSFVTLENEDGILNDQLEYIIRKAYEFFVLGARRNFKKVIAQDIVNQLRYSGFDNAEEEEYFAQALNMLRTYPPLIDSVCVIKFLQYCGDGEIVRMYKYDQITGNFLRKYSPKLYENESLITEIMNYIMSTREFKSKGETPV